MRGLLVLGAALVLPAAAGAAPQVKIPDCPALVSWSENAAPNQNFNPAPRLTLSKAFEDSVLVPVFGVPVLNWTQEDAQAVSQALVKCFQQAGQKRDQASAAALSNANRALGAVVPTNAAVQRARNDADAAKKQLDALPNSPELGHALDVATKGHPAQPDMGGLRGLPREIGDPSARLMQAVTMLPDADRATLYQALGERRDTIEGSLVKDARQKIDTASQDAAGILTLLQVRAVVAPISDDATRAQLRKSADDKAAQIRATLRQAKPAVVVLPNCFDLYRWSGGPGATVGMGIGGRNMLMAFTDDRVIPVFGISVADWTDADVAQLKTLRGICQAASPRTIPGAGAPPDQGDLMTLANRGRWIEGADQQIADARAALGTYHKAQQAMQADLGKIQALPNTAQSMLAMAQIASDPALGQVTQDDRNKVFAALNAKKAAIAAQATDAAIKGLAGVKVAEFGDIKNLFAYVRQTLPTIPDPRGHEAFREAFNHTLQQTTARLLPEYKAKLASTPLRLTDVTNTEVTLLQLQQAPFGVVNTPAYQIYFEATRQANDAMMASARKKACDDFAASVGVSGDAASQPVWRQRDSVSLSEFLCEIDEHGTVNSYSGPGMFSSTSTLKVTPLKAQEFTISLHKVEVQQGKPMLVGFEIKDASQAGGPAPAQGQPGYSTTPNGPVTVEGWEIFVPDIIGLNGDEATECTKTIDSPSPDSLSPAAKVFWLKCWSYNEVRVHEAKLHSPPH